MIMLDEKQTEAHQRAVEYVSASGGHYFSIGGYAGTGKTTVAKQVIATLDTFALRAKVCAFAGKAAHVLRKKGVLYANTIHRTIYEYDDRTETFHLKKHLDADYILLDEASMVPTNLWEDLRSFGKPIICVGDPGQLEPIGEDARLMHSPNIVLDTIHRYQGSIAWFANHIRTEGCLPPNGGGDEVSLLSQSRFMSWFRGLSPCGRQDYTYLVGKNKTRVGMNKEFTGSRSIPILARDKLIVLLNDRHHGVFNGQFLTVETVLDRRGDYTLANVSTDDSRIIPEMKLWYGQLHKENQVDWKRVPKKMVAVDYGYATTVHKFQGSEDEKIVVIDESSVFGPGEGQVRWLYTACTRASKELKVFA
jgi:exodeoxyribonuclease-5